MSEAVDLLFFRNIIDKADILKTALDYCQDKLHNHRSEVIRKRFDYMSDLKHFMDIYENHGEIRIWDLTRNDIFVLESLFMHKFIYWKNYKLLAVLGDADEPTSFDLWPITFQNMTDQDYDYSVWNGIICDHENNLYRTDLKRFIERIADGREDNKVRIALNDYFFDDDCPDPFSTPETQDERIYYRQTYVYKHIEDELHIRKWLYNSIPDDMISFSLSDARIGEYRTDIMRDVIVYLNEECKTLSDNTPTEQQKE